MFVSTDLWALDAKGKPELFGILKSVIRDAPALFSTALAVKRKKIIAAFATLSNEVCHTTSNQRYTHVRGAPSMIRGL